MHVRKKLILPNILYSHGRREGRKGELYLQNYFLLTNTLISLLSQFEKKDTTEII